MGSFIAIEGPNGVGKTTVARLLADQLRKRQVPVHLTTEPSATALGRLVRSSEAVLHGRALALAVAADRYAHLEHEILPELGAGKYVITDRYVQSSLVLQRLDGLPTAEIWSYNRYVLAPTVSIYLQDDPRVIEERLDRRNATSRLEHVGSAAQELGLYDEAFEFLNRKRWRQRRIDCRSSTPEDVVAKVVAVVELSAGTL